ncbi:hypothetical protein YC2023_022883 [Brassica napus]
MQCFETRPGPAVEPVNPVTQKKFVTQRPGKSSGSVSGSGLKTLRTCKLYIILYISLISRKGIVTVTYELRFKQKRYNHGFDNFESSYYTAKLWAQLRILPSSSSHRVNPVRALSIPLSS